MRESAQLLARAGWSEVLDSVLRGLRHDLNSRVASLDAIVTLIALGDLDEPPSPTVAAEVDRLTTVVRLLGLLPGDLQGEPIPLMPQEVVASAIQLATTAMNATDRSADLVVEQDAPPILANEARVLRSTVLLLHRVMSHSSAGLEVVVSGDEQHAQLMFRPRGLEAGPDGGPDAGIYLGSETEAEALTALFELDGGVLSRQDFGMAIRFDSLARARAAGR